jgi:hypothetical protein
MESFFLSETLKYLYLLFDVDNPINKGVCLLFFSLCFCLFVSALLLLNPHALSLPGRQLRVQH